MRHSSIEAACLKLIFMAACKKVPICLYHLVPSQTKQWYYWCVVWIGECGSALISVCDVWQTFTASSDG